LHSSEGVIEDDTVTSSPRGVCITFLLSLVASQPFWAHDPQAKSGDRGGDRAAIIAGIKRRGGWVKPDDPKASQPVVEVHLSHRDVTDTDIALLAGLTEVRSLELIGTSVTDAGMASLKSLVNLEELNLVNNRISDAGLSGLADLVNLRRLKLSFCTITGSGLVNLKALARLQQLDLTLSRASDASLAALEQATDLRTLTLQNTDVSDAGLKHLAGLTRLQSLSLSGTRVSDAGLEHLKGMADLKILALDTTAVNGSGLRHLAGATALEELYLGKSGVTDAGLENLKLFKNLRRLRLWGTSLTDAGLAHLADLLRLEHLELVRTGITDAGLVHLKPLVDLYYLDMNGTRVTPDAARRLQQSLADTHVVDGDGQTVGNKVPYNGLGLQDITRQKQSPLIDRAMPKLTALLARSAEARRNVAGPLATAAKPLLFGSRNPSDRAYQERLRRDLAARTEEAVERSRRYERLMHPSGTSVSFLPASGIVVAEFVFPPVTVTPTHEKGDLTIDFWVCPDRTSALGLYWLRSGQILSVGYGRHSEVERAVAKSTPIGERGHDGRFWLPKPAEDVGESAYWLDPNSTSQLPSRGPDEAAEANRYSFLRGNVVVEIAIPEYVRQRNGGKLIWLCSSSEYNAKEFLDIARAIDQDLVGMGAHQIGPLP
jgi:internalin A